MKSVRLPLVIRGALAIAVLILLPAFMMTAYLYKQDRDSAIDTEIRRINGYSKEVAVQIDSFIVSIKNVARYAAVSSEMQNILHWSDNPAAVAKFTTWLRHWAKIAPSISDVYVLNMEGKCLAGTNADFIGKNYAMRPYFKEARSGRSYISDWTVGVTSQKAGVYLSSPIIDSDGSIGGVLVVKLTIDTIDSIINRCFKLGIQAFVVNNAGVILSSYNPALRYSTLADLTPAENFSIRESRQFADIPQSSLKLESLRRDAALVHPGETRLSTEYRFHGERKIAALTGLNSRDWVVGIAVPFSIVEAPANRLLLRSSYLFCLVLLFTGISSYYASRFIARPLATLAHDVTLLASGDYSVQSAVRGDAEVVKVAQAFNAMSRTILMREQQLIKLQNYLLNIIDSMPFILISLDSDGRVTHWNIAATAAYGIESREAVGQMVWDIYPELIRYRGLFKEVLESNCSKTLMRELIPAATPRYYDISVFPLPADGYKNDNGVVFLLNDITEKETAEGQLRHMQKIEMVGALASGLAHDFNNVLCGILGTVTVLQMQILRGKELSADHLFEKTGVVIELGNRAADIVAQLMIVSRKQHTVFGPVDLTRAFRNVTKICQNTFDKSIKMSTAIPDALIYVTGDPVQIEQVLLNLCINASHAMTIMRTEGSTHGGELVLATERLVADRHFCVSHPEAVNGEEYWLISVSDTGIGMDTKTIANIFEPFFTTKETGIGTGLGLAMVSNIVRQHKGFIEVCSNVGVGSTFNVFLPRYCGNGEMISENVHENLPLGEGLLLVVDDEPFICQAAQSILEECGYKVILAENGDVAVAIYNERSHEITAVIMDIIMPKKSGMEAFIEMKKINPEVRVLLSSGFIHDSRVAVLTDMGVKDVIKKPFTMIKLATAVSRLLAS